MKTLIILGEGIADRPPPDGKGRTPLEAARTPALDRLANEGEAGGWAPAPPGASAGVETAVQALLGYREPIPPGVIDAAAAGVALREGEVAFRAHLVCLKAGATSVVMLDPEGAGVTEEEGRNLIEYLQARLVVDPGEEIALRSLGAHRALLTYRREAYRPSDSGIGGFSPPEGILGESISEHLPTGEEARRFVHIVNDSQMILASHPGLRAKSQESMFAANSLWIWGGGVRRRVPPFAEKWRGRRAAFHTSNPALAALGRILEAEVVGPAEGGGRADAVRRSLRESEVVVVSEGEACAASRRGDVEGKISAIEAFDAELVAPLLADPGVDAPLRILCLSSHVAPSEGRAAASEPVPFALADWEAGRLQPPPRSVGASLWRALRGARGGGRGPSVAGFSELLCKEGPVLGRGALSRRILTG